MSPRATLRILGSAWLLVAGAACGSTQPNPAEEVYRLQTLNESALPYDHEGLGCCVYLSGSLTLREGRYEMAITFRNRNSGLEYTAEEWGSYTLVQEALSFVGESYAVAPIGLDSGVLEGGGLRLTFGGEGPGSPDQFRAFLVPRD